MFDFQNKLKSLSDSSSSTENDFDFLLGDWNINNTMWIPFSQSTHPKEKRNFESQLSVKKIVGGFGQIDIYRSKEIDASTLRLFDPKTKLWNLYWITSNNPVVNSPVIGCFQQENGEFFEIFKDDKGKRVVIRFTWSNIHLDNPRWEQFFSFDEGDDWERNWVMDFKRSETDLEFFV